YEQYSGNFSRQHSRRFHSKRYFAVSCGIGFDAAVCEEALASSFKNFLNKMGLGKLTYLTIALKQLIKARKVTCTITLDGGKPVYLPKFLFVANMIHQYEGGGFKFCPGADYHDGLIDICCIGNIPKWLAFLALPTAFTGNHYRFNGIDHYAASRIHLETSTPLWVHTDGEVTMKSSSITLTCEQNKLQFLL
ncbi:MAG: diacylglycerol kinase family lipid kinase, partial [Lachnospiraceae bacterium]|nr:diacylglycerol kinase family lipid kinase [Lachnospiraceae bacterium]